MAPNLQAPAVEQVTGAGAGRCAVCHGKLDFSWWITFTDGSMARFCSADVPRSEVAR